MAIPKSSVHQLLRAQRVPEPLSSLLSLLDELSCPPWKFDLIWDLWPTLDMSVARYRELATVLLADPLHEAFPSAMMVFDDLTIFGDVVGDSETGSRHDRSPHRVAYLSLRPMVLRTITTEPPEPPGGETREGYVLRLLYLGATLQPAELPAARAVLERAATRYEARGKASGAELCRQNVAMLSNLVADAQLGTGVEALGLPPFLKGPRDPAIAWEAVLQWWPTIGKPARDHLQTLVSGEDAETADAARGQLELIDALAPFAQLAWEHPGLPSSIAGLSALRYITGRALPDSARHYPLDWLEAAQEALTLLRRDLPPDHVASTVAAGLVSGFVQLTLARRSASGDGATEELFAADLADFLVPVTDAAARRARRELSRDQYEAVLMEHLDRARRNPLNVEFLLHQGARLYDRERTLAEAYLEGLEILARKLRRPELLRTVQRLIYSQVRVHPAQVAEHAATLERQGRPELAYPMWRNLAVKLLEQGDTSSSLASAQHAWGLVHQISQDPGASTRWTTRDLTLAYLDVGEVLSQALLADNQPNAALAVAEEGLKVGEANDWTAAGTLDSETRSRQAQSLRLHLRASAALQRIEGPHAAEARLRAMYPNAQTAGLHAESALIAMQLAYLRDLQGGGSSQEVDDLLSQARADGERARRAAVFELDRVDVMGKMQPAYVPAAERRIQSKQPWDALAILEALRSRALLDLLGISSALELALWGSQPQSRVHTTIKRLRTVATPMTGQSSIGYQASWIPAFSELETELEATGESTTPRGRRVLGTSLEAGELREWARTVERPTAVVSWLLGEQYSYQLTLLAGSRTDELRVTREPVTFGLLAGAAEKIETAVRARSNPAPALLAELATRLVEPIADLLQEAELVYLCPSQQLHALPLGALALQGQPLAVAKEVAIVPSLSILRVLQHIDAAAEPSTKAVVCGPELPRQAARVASILKTAPIDSILAPASRAPAPEVNSAEVLHLICHGEFDDNDPWNSGLIFNSPNGVTDRVTGRDLFGWNLQARLAVLQACDTRRQFISSTEDGFGLGRFLHLAGVPSIVLADWEVRDDITMHYIRSFYSELGNQAINGHRRLRRGAAHRAGVAAVRKQVGHEQTFFWAPFVLIGVAD